MGVDNIATIESPKADLIVLILPPSLRGTSQLPYGKGDGSDTPNAPMHRRGRDSCAWYQAAYPRYAFVNESYLAHPPGRSTFRVDEWDATSWCRSPIRCACVRRTLGAGARHHRT